MALDAGLSILHFAFAFLLVGALVAEAFILRLPINARTAQLLLRVDLFYGLSALGLILAGVSRVVWGAKGWAFYQGEPFFWAKIAVFAIIGALSVAPTLAFIRWTRSARTDAAFSAGEAEVKRIRTLVALEAHLIVLVIVFAALMARGISF